MSLHLPRPELFLRARTMTTAATSENPRAYCRNAPEFHRWNTGLDRESLSILIGLCECGVNPEALAHVVKELRREGAALRAQLALDDDALIGIGARVLDGSRIGRFSLIGAGASQLAASH